METVNITLVYIITGSMIVEAVLSAADDWRNYERKDTLTNLGLAAIGAIVNFFVKGFVLSLFIFISSFALYQLDVNSLYWPVLFLLVDFHYYLFHWLGHKSRFFWAMHVIHHSSPRYNLTTALRTPFTNSVFRFGSMMPIILLGFEPLHVLFIDTLILTFTFFQHTELIRKLGWLEYVLSTPSHHRVHHASDEKYIDKNFGGVLIVWDKLFGTFQQEEEYPTYGLTKPLKNSSLVHVIFHEWNEMIRDIRTHRNGWHRIMLILGRPGWKPRYTPTFSISFLSLPKHLLISLTLALLAISTSYAQTTDEYLTNGIAAEERHEDDMALWYYEQAIRLNPEEGQPYWRASRMYSYRAGRNPDKVLKHQYGIKASALADQALLINPDDIDARLALIISYGMLSEAATSPKEKLKNARRIRQEAERLLKFNSSFAPAYYVLGKWHYELSRLNWFERTACDLLFGGMPEGVSIESSLKYFEKAVALQPDYILFRYGQACALYDKGEHQATIKNLEEAMRLSPKEPDDQVRLKKCAVLLEKSRRSIQSKTNS